MDLAQVCSALRGNAATIMLTMFNPLPPPGISARAQSAPRYLPSAAVGHG